MFNGNPTKLANGRSLYDFAISAPKSVSVVAILQEDRRLIDAHQAAVRVALRELETWAAARIRQSAPMRIVHRNLIVALYGHDTSRGLDPQLHAHAVAASLTFDGAEGRWKGLQASDICERRAYLTDVYRNELAREVRALGYEIDNRRDSNGNLSTNPCGENPQWVLFSTTYVPLPVGHRRSSRNSFLRWKVVRTNSRPSGKGS